MSLAQMLEYGFVFLILAVCSIFIWRKMSRTVRGEDTTCGCEGGCHGVSAKEKEERCPAAVMGNLKNTTGSNDKTGR